MTGRKGKRKVVGRTGKKDGTSKGWSGVEKFSKLLSLCKMSEIYWCWMGSGLDWRKWRRVG